MRLSLVEGIELWLILCEGIDEKRVDTQNEHVSINKLQRILAKPNPHYSRRIDPHNH